MGTIFGVRSRGAFFLWTCASRGPSLVPFWDVSRRIVSGRRLTGPRCLLEQKQIILSFHVATRGRGPWYVGEIIALFYESDVHSSCTPRRRSELQGRTCLGFQVCRSMLFWSNSLFRQCECEVSILSVARNIVLVLLIGWVRLQF